MLCSTWIGVSKLCEFFPDLGLTTGAVHAKENYLSELPTNWKIGTGTLSSNWHAPWGHFVFCFSFQLSVHCIKQVQDFKTKIQPSVHKTLGLIRGWREFNKMFWTFSKSYDISKYHCHPFKIKSYFQNCKTTNTIDQTIQSSYMFTSWLMHSHQKVTH